MGNGASQHSILAQYRHASNQNPADTNLSAGTNFNYETTFKAVLKLSDTEMTLFANGTKIGPQPIQKQSTIQRLDLIASDSTADTGHHVNKVMVFPMTLSDAQCVELTQ